ncbi:unnamed protein product [Blepharisma stoltei]|uniref:G domain-containing protein n=1 Tax=Blepharisma stoltei TaxID=1481888 RepID=A0AAU9IXI4_9CILI|nr:unnamed protein product [Blepharisma stoltei]
MINSFPIFRVSEVEVKPNSDSDPISELSFTLADSKTSQLIFQSPSIELSQISNLAPIQLLSDTEAIITLSIYIKSVESQNLLGSASINLAQDFPLKKWLNIQSEGKEILSIEIEVNKVENLENSFEIIEESLEKSDFIEKLEINKSLQMINIEENKNDQEIDNNEIEEVKKNIASHHSKEFFDKDERESLKLKDSERLKELYEETKNAKNRDLPEENDLEDILKQGLSKYNIESPKELEELINITKESIALNLRKKKTEKAKKEENKLADLEKLLSIDKQITLKSMIILDFKEIGNDKKIGFIEAMINDISEIPYCTERFLTSILCFAYYKSYNFEIAPEFQEKIENLDIEKEYSNFLQVLSALPKGFLSRKLISSFKENFINKNWKNLIKDTEKILKEYRPVNIKELKRLINKSVQRSEDLQNKDIILLIGITGSGKSTTTHFLCDSKMERVMEDGVRHIKAIAVKNPILKNINISSHAESETRYIIMVPINFKNFEEIFICDPPGLLDTKGAEVDMANTISIIECVKKCRSVRPLILLSCKTEGDRFEGVKKIAHTLARLVPNFNKYSRSFTYAFTKYTAQEASNINALVTNALGLLENPDEAFLHILQDIKYKTKNGAITIDPLRDDPQELLTKIMERAPILDPKTAFVSFITEDSRKSIKEQVLLHSKDILIASNPMDYKIIKYKLDELKYLGSLFEQFLSQYKESAEHVIKSINDLYNNTVNQFNSFIDKNGSLDENTIKSYEVVYNIIKKFEEIRDSHLRGETVTSAAMLTNIVSKLDLTNLNLKSDNIDPDILNVQLNNVKILSETFEDVVPHYKNLFNEYSNLIESLLSSATSNLEEKNFKNFAKDILQEQKYLRIARTHFDLTAFDERHNDLLKKLSFTLKENHDNSIAILSKGRFEKSDIEPLNQNISIIKSFIGSRHFNGLIAKDELENQLQSILDVYQKHFEDAKSNVISFINDKTTYNIAEIETKFDEFSYLMEIPDIASLITASYQNVLSSLINKISFFKKEAREFVKSLTRSPESTDLEALRNCFSWLESGKWIEKFQKGTYSNELSGIEKEIKNYTKKLLDQLKAIDLGINCPLNVAKGYCIVQKLDPILQLKEFIPSLENSENDIWIKFQERIKDTLKIIKKEFCPEQSDIEREINDLERLQKIRLDYSKYKEENKNSECQELLKNNGFETFKEINLEITKIQNFINIFNQKLTKNTPNVDKIENYFNYIQECKSIPQLSEFAISFSQGILSNLSQFYNNSLISLAECFDSIARNISDDTNCDFDSVKQYSHQFSLNFKEILLLNKKSPSFFNFLDFQPQFEHFANELNNLRITFHEKLKISNERNDLVS